MTRTSSICNGIAGSTVTDTEEIWPARPVGKESSDDRKLPTAVELSTDRSCTGPMVFSVASISAVLLGGLPVAGSTRPYSSTRSYSTVTNAVACRSKSRGTVSVSSCNDSDQDAWLRRRKSSDVTSHTT